ncbi:MAG: phosphate ABC transporter permease PstA [Planctomycetia bacterium]|nr:phosphate ABC transporter permease PstA [Planctomycetia bacterium]
MSSETPSVVAAPALAAPALAPPATRAPSSDRGRRGRIGGTVLSSGEPMVWLTGGALTIALAMIVCLLALIVSRGLTTFWPAKLVQIRTAGGQMLLGEVTGRERYTPDSQMLAERPPADAERIRAAAAAGDGTVERRWLRTGNFDVAATHFQWIDEPLIVEETQPEWACLVERRSWGRFHGFARSMLVDGEPVATEPAAVWRAFDEHHAAARDRLRKRTRLAKHDLGAVSRRKNDARLDVIRARLSDGAGSPAHAAAQAELAREEVWETAENARVAAEIDALDKENARYQLLLATADGQEKLVPLAEIVRAYSANRLSWFDRLGVYLSRWGEFLSDEPREANSEGGVFPAIWGTVAMTLFMSLAVVPFGVLAALYLREYARPGLPVSVLRIAVNNLAGVPSIVFGVFGLGFFCYVVGVRVDQLLFPAELSEHTPTFGTGGLLWASLTLALLTLPVVIVTTEEALAAVPGSMREGSYACGASKWQTIWRIVLPRALPGVMTGVILAMARGAGEVAPLMLVGAMKSASELPIDGAFPFVHPQRSFMHLGFHLYDLGFHSQNSEAARPMVFTTALLLIAIVAVLNVTAVRLRSRLRKRFGVESV